MCQWKKNWCLRMVDSSIRYLVTTINHVMMIDVVAGGHVQQNLLWQHRGVGAALHELSKGGDGGESVLQWNLRLLWQDSAITKVEVSWTAAATQKRRQIRREQSQEWQCWQTSERSFCQEQVTQTSIFEFRGPSKFQNILFLMMGHCSVKRWVQIVCHNITGQSSRDKFPFKKRF